nr:MAG TPA: hypothetical protein [Caudoviricetes sp.]
MTKMKQLKDANDQNIYPVTHEKAVMDSNGESIASKINLINLKIENMNNNIPMGNNNHSYTVNTSANLKLGYNNILADEQELILPEVDDNFVSVVNLFVEVNNKEKKVYFNTDDIYWEQEPYFDKLGIYRIRLERSLTKWIGSYVYCVSNNPENNPSYLKIKEKLTKNNYDGIFQIVDSEVNENEDIAVILNRKYNWGSKVKVYYYVSEKFYWLNTEKVENGIIKFKSCGAGVYFVALDTAPLYDTDAMELIYSDEFNGNGDIDHSRWTREVHEAGWTNDEAQYYTDRIDNSYIENDKLVIKAMKEAYGNGQYTSARLISKESFLYGKFDIVAKLPTGKGTWPAIWMMPSDNLYGEWPKSGEIDIMENVGKDPEWIHGSLHSEKYNFRNGNQVTKKVSIPTNYSEYHTYSVIWTPEYLEFLVDEVSYQKHSYDEAVEPYRWKAYPYDKPYNILLNLAIGGNWGGEIDDSIMPSFFYIDSVKVYDLGFTKYDKTLPDKVEGLKFAETDNVLSWNYTHDNVAVKEYEITLNNGEILNTYNNYIVLNSIDTIGATSASVSSVDYSQNKSKPTQIQIQPKALDIIHNETKPLVANWNTYSDSSLEAPSLVQGSNGLVLNINEGGQNSWDIQLMKNNIQLVSNTKYSYVISLSSTVDRNVKLVVQNSENYQGVHYNDIHLKANETIKFEGSFFYTGGNINSDLVLQLGGSDSNIAGSSISLSKFILAKEV